MLFYAHAVVPFSTNAVMLFYTSAIIVFYTNAINLFYTNTLTLFYTNAVYWISISCHTACYLAKRYFPTVHIGAHTVEGRRLVKPSSRVTRLLWG